MELSLPEFQFRFIPGAGNVIFPGNFHPVGAQRAAQAMIDRAVAGGTGSGGGVWLIMGASGGFGSAARVALATRLGADTIGLSLDQEPNPGSGNKVRKIGSPGFHRNLAIERGLRQLGRRAESGPCDAFDPEAPARAVALLRERFDGARLAGIVWALAAPRAIDPRTGNAVQSSLRALGRPARLKTFAGPTGDEAPRIVELDIPAGTPEEAVATQYVMGGRIVEHWVDALLRADALAEGVRLLTISYRGTPLNAAIYRDGLIGLAKADLEFHTRALDAVLQRRLGGHAWAVEGPAVVTEASGGIPGVPLYLALCLDVMGERHEDPLASMLRLTDEHLLAPGGPILDAEGLLRLDDREIAPEVQEGLLAHFHALPPGAALDRRLYDRFMTEYARTRGFSVPGVDYSAPFDTDDVCR